MASICRLLLFVHCIIFILFKVQASASANPLTDSNAYGISAASEESEVPYYLVPLSSSVSVLGNMLTWYTACYLAQKASGTGDDENSCLFFASLVTMIELPALEDNSPEVYYPFWYQILRFSGFGLVIYQASCPIHGVSKWCLANAGLKHLRNEVILKRFVSGFISIQQRISSPESLPTPLKSSNKEAFALSYFSGLLLAQTLREIASRQGVLSRFDSRPWVIAYIAGAAPYLLYSMSENTDNLMDERQVLSTGLSGILGGSLAAAHVYLNPRDDFTNDILRGIGAFVIASGCDSGTGILTAITLSVLPVVFTSEPDNYSTKNEIIFSTLLFVLLFFGYDTTENFLVSDIPFAKSLSDSSWALWLKFSDPATYFYRLMY